MSEDKQYDFYVAGPFFDPEQTASMERLEKILEDHGKVLFKPRFVSQIEEVGPEGCFADDIHGINAAKAVVANLMDEDPGTIVRLFREPYTNGSCQSDDCASGRTGVRRS